MYGVAPVNGIGVLTPFLFLPAPARRGGPCCQTTRPESGVVVRLSPIAIARLDLFGRRALRRVCRDDWRRGAE